MSDTDDTDVLLLIPPDFFYVHTDSDSSFTENWNYDQQSGAIQSLIEELDDIKSRVASIENNSEISSICRRTREDFESNDSIMSTRQYHLTEDYHNPKFTSTSAKSTPQKPRMKSNLNSLPNTPNHDKRKFRRSVTDLNTKYDTKIQQKNINYQNNDRDADESSLTTTPEKKNKEVLGEIDQFLSHVKTIRRYVAQKKLENSFLQDDKQPQSLPISFDDSPLKLSDLNSDKTDKRLDLKDVDKLLKEMEKQQKKMEKHKPLVDVKRVVEGDEIKIHTWKPGENDNTLPNYHELFAKKENKQTNVHNCLPPEIKSDLYFDIDTVNSDSTNDTSPPTVFEKSLGDDVYLRQTGLALNSNVDENAVYKQKTDKNYEVEELITKQLSATTNSQPSLRYKRSQFYDLGVISSDNLYEIMDPKNNHGGDYVPISKDPVTKKILKKFEEEKLRRQHCEKIIQDLQLKQLELQQRLAVIVQLDCAKDAAILRFHEAWEKVSDRWQMLETERNQLAEKLNTIRGQTDNEVLEAKKRVSQYEIEISQALDLAHKNQEKCQSYEKEKSELLTDLEINKTELEKTTNKLFELENERKDIKLKYIDLEKSNIEDKKLLLELQKEKEALQSNHNKELSDYKTQIKQLQEHNLTLEKQIKNIKGSCEDLTNKNKNLEQSLQNYKKAEKTLQHELKSMVEQGEKAKMELRNFYQQQVELLVKDKLKEFQNQLEQTEQTLHDELQNREQSIAKTAAKQLQKLTDRHQLEIQLVEEKHREEIKLYEIQITQLKHIVTTQQYKLDEFQMKRNNIVEELKTVMEAQWQEALKVLSDRTPPDNSKLIGIKPRFENCKSRVDAKKCLSLKDYRDEDNYYVPEQEKHEKYQQEKDYSTPLSARSEYQQDNSIQKYIKMLLDKEPGSVYDDNNGKHHDKNDSVDNCSFLNMKLNEEMNEKKIQSKESQTRSTSKPPWKYHK